MRIFSSLAALTTLLLIFSEASAGELAYVEWTRSFDQGTKSWGYNAFDDREQSVWCSGPDGVGDQLVVGLIGNQKIDEVGLIIGAVDKKGVLDTTRARVKALRVSDGRTQQLLSFADKPSLQLVRINPALNSKRLTFKVEDVYFGARRSDPVCISSIVLRKGGSVINNARVGSKMRAIKPAEAELLHLWVDAPGAPERYLTFGLDGTFSWVYAPILEGKPAKITGHWKRKGDSLRLSPSRGKSLSLKMSFGRVADGEQVFSQLVIEGKGPHPAFAATYQAASSAN